MERTSRVRIKKVLFKPADLLNLAKIHFRH